jgi:hypothetical protein
MIMIMINEDDFDAYPVVRLRPILSPPRGGADNEPDPELFAFYDPTARRVAVLDDAITRFPAIIRHNGSVLAGQLGQAIFVGAHLLAPAKRGRLIQVLEGIHGQDLLVGANRRWVESAGVRTDWRPSQQTKDEFRSVGLFARSQAPMPTKPSARVDHTEPELIS